MAISVRGNGFLGKFLLYVPVKLLPAFLTVFFIFFLYRFFPEDEYVSYSVSLSCSLIVAQLSAMWVGNSYVYYFSSSADQRALFSSCLYLVTSLAPFAALVAALVSILFSSAPDTFYCVLLLCLTQMYFFFMSSVCQAAFLVRQQLLAVVMQVVAQLGVIYFCYSSLGVTYSDAMFALSAGYGMAALIMLIGAVVRMGIHSPLAAKKAFGGDVRAVFNYGSALAPWMLGMLLMVAADRFAIGSLGIPGGDSYLSMKDLFVGAGGLLSMPLLMLVHPLIIKRFRDGVFEGALIQSSVGFLVVVFSLLWAVIALVGLSVFEQFTGKPISAPLGVLLIAYLGVFLNCAAVYAQKRLEVHRRMRLLAYFSLMAALVSLGLSYVGGLLLGLYGVALGVVIGQLLYFGVVTATILRKVDLYRGVVKPFVVSMMALAMGYLLQVALDASLGGVVWWVRALVWTLLFSFFSLIVVWKAVSWRDFMNAKMD
ncbi:sugar transporter [Pseudomonas sp. NLJ1]|uniref:sugar transporter n=1 Tax=Pseudomonas sp. NLJ1 TaxID=3086079 RepID=UPI003C6C4088